MRANEGVRRLSPVIGFLAALPPLFLAISGLIVEWPKRLPEIVGIEIGGGGCFLLGWCAVRVIAWIVEGFRPSSSEKKETVTFEDANLEAIVRDSINKPEGDILSTEVSKITKLSAENKNIRSLKGIKSLTALKELDLHNNPLSADAFATQIPALEA